MAALQDSQDVTLALADSDLFHCWEKKVRQGRECSLLLEHQHGKVTTTFKVCKVLKYKAKTPETDSKALAEKKIQKKGGKKLTKLLAYHKRLCDEKGLPPSNLMLQHAAESSSSSPTAQKPGQEDGSTFKCDRCEILLKSKQKLRKHMRKKHIEIQKPEVLRIAEADKSLNLSVSNEERSNTSLPVNDSIVKADKESDQILWDLMVVTGECGFCDYKHPVSYKSLDQRNMCDAYPERQSELYDHMDTNHMEVVEMLDEY